MFRVKTGQGRVNKGDGSISPDDMAAIPERVERETFFGNTARVSIRPRGIDTW